MLRQSSVQSAKRGANRDSVAEPTNEHLPHSLRIMQVGTMRINHNTLVVQRIVVLQYNSAILRRVLPMTPAAAERGDRSNLLHLKAPRIRPATEFGISSPLARRSALSWGL